MRPATARLIIEGGTLTPGILRVLSRSEGEKLQEIWGRLDRLSDVIMVFKELERVEENPEFLMMLTHIVDCIDDVATIAETFAKVVPGDEKVAA